MPPNIATESQQSFAHHTIMTGKKIADERKKRERDLGITSNVFSTLQIAQTLGLSTSLAFDQIKLLSNSVSPVLDFFKTNMGAFTLAFSAITVISSVAGIFAALKQGGKKEAMAAVLGEHGLEKIISGVIGSVAGGLMMALASQPIAVIVVAATSFVLQQLTAISFTIARIVAIKKEIKDFQNRRDELNDNHPLKPDFDKQIKQLNKQLHGERVKLIMSSCMLAAGATAFSLLCVGMVSSNPILLGIGAVIMVAMGLIALTMMAIKVHKKRMADKKETPAVAPAPIEAQAPNKPTVSKKKQSISPVSSSFKEHYEQSLADRTRPNSFNSYFPQNPHAAAIIKQAETKPPIDRKATHRGILGMAKAARKSATRKAHANEPSNSSPKPAETNHQTHDIRHKPQSMSVSARDILTQAKETDWSPPKLQRSQSLPSAFQTKPWPHPSNGA